MYEKRIFAMYYEPTVGLCVPCGISKTNKENLDAKWLSIASFASDYGDIVRVSSKVCFKLA
jgi:hypothetical protein